MLTDLQSQELQLMRFSLGMIEGHMAELRVLQQEAVKELREIRGELSNRKDDGR